MQESEGHPAGQMSGTAPSAAAVEQLLADGPLLDTLAESQRRGFLGPGPVAAHVVHGAGFLSVVGAPDTLLDLGRGGGLPGLVLARALPDTTIVLLDAMERRCRFLEWAVGRLSLGDRIDVRCGRAEELARQPELRGQFPMVVTRSFGAPAVTAECAVGFLRPPHGRLVVSEPPQSSDRWPAAGLLRLGLRPAVRVVGDGWTVQCLELVGDPDERYPRRTGVPAKRPLF